MEAAGCWRLTEAAVETKDTSMNHWVTDEADEAEDAWRSPPEETGDGRAAVSHFHDFTTLIVRLLHFNLQTSPSRGVCF
ncbi:hypothetical protein EYF80_059912 [Liparis tanakae]|uniref:Uncharacterized protein n=1 Tax=Liparis tanakae TaxID=230148 RepID=A0A4Z2EMF0_9TELE|nr:hypothetical protein EYF80_059912 [Liparis tanakae]